MDLVLVGPCLPRDNRAFGKYAENLGLKYNLGTTTDDFNNEHAKFLKNYFVEKNTNNLPFCFRYITYKRKMIFSQKVNSIDSVMICYNLDIKFM
jgi:hypothetical protein